MAESESSSEKGVWDSFVKTGKFDEIKQPEGGYKRNDVVIGYDGKGYIIKGIKGGEVVLGPTIKSKEKERTCELGFIRPVFAVALEMGKAGFAKVPEKRTDMPEPETIKIQPSYNEEGVEKWRIDMIEKTLADLREETLKEVYGPAIAERKARAFLTKAFSFIKGSQIISGPVTGETIQEASFVFPPQLTSPDEFYTVDFYREQWGNTPTHPRAASEVTVRRFYVKTIGDIQQPASEDVFCVWLEHSIPDRAKVPQTSLNTAHGKIIPIPEDRFIDKVEMYLGREADPEMTLDQRPLFPSLPKFLDQSPNLGISRGLRECDLSFIALISQSIDSGKPDDDGVQLSQNIERLKEREQLLIH